MISPNTDEHWDYDDVWHDGLCEECRLSCDFFGHGFVHGYGVHLGLNRYLAPMAWEMCAGVQKKRGISDTAVVLGMDICCGIFMI